MKSFSKKLEEKVGVRGYSSVLGEMNKVYAVSSGCPQFEPLLSAEEAAPLLAIHPKTLVKMARAGDLPALRIGKHWRFRASLLDIYVKSQLNSVCQPA